MKYCLSLFLFGILVACTSSPSTEVVDAMNEPAKPITDSAAWVVQQAIDYQGGALLDSSTVNFAFRDQEYRATRQGRQFLYERTYTNKKGKAIVDRMTNDSFSRQVNGQVAELSEKQVSSYSNSLNSVMYFAFLPYFLQDQAVNLDYRGLTNILSKPHYELRVTFAEEGGGKDFEDEYVYWFSTEDFSLNYLAYNFLVNGGGARFREAYNTRTVSGITFHDFINYKPQEDRRDVLSFESLFEKGLLDTLSRIELENIVVE